MKNIVEFPDTAAIGDEAAEWLMRLDSEEPLSESEKESLAEWIKRSPAHRERLMALAGLWERLNVLTELAVPLSPASTTKPARVRKWAPGLAVASAVIAVVASFVYFQPQVTPSVLTETNGLYSSAIGEQRSARLSDGSEIVLNTNSQIEVDFNGDRRDIRLIQGEVMFTVAKDPTRPFRVFAGGGRIQAIGTEFVVYLKDDSVDVTVTEGVVSLAAAPTGGSVPPDLEPGMTVQTRGNELGRLSAGQVATLPRLDESQSGDGMTSIPEARDVQDVELTRRMSWTGGNLVFAGESLEHVVGEIGRYTTVKIEFADPEVRAIRVGGVFPVGETSAMFGALEGTFGLKVTYLSANRVIISAGE